MSWKPINSAETRRAKFLGILPELPAISTAPDSVTKVSGWERLEQGAERDQFESNFWRTEAERFYKAIDGGGIVWKMRNPAAIRHTKSFGPGKPVDYGERERLGHFDDFRSSEKFEPSNTTDW